MDKAEKEAEARMITYNEHVEAVERVIGPTGVESHHSDRGVPIAHAILALAEQQRIANLITLATYAGENDEAIDLLRMEAVNALTKWVPHSPDDEHPEVRPEIANALGIKTGGNA